MEMYRLIVLAVFTAADLAIVAKAFHAAYRSNLLGRFSAAAVRGVAAVRAVVPGRAHPGGQGVSNSCSAKMAKCWGRNTKRLVI